MKAILLIISTALAAALLASAAQAHVTVHPNALPAGGFQVVDVRVPNERPVPTTKVDVKFPAGFLFLSYQPVPGWKTQVIYRKLAKPVTVFGERYTREVDRVVWSGGRIRPGQFVEFPLSVRIPEAKGGTTLTFKALQTYSSGEIVRWIGNPSADEPAPQVLVRDANSPVEDYPAGINAAKKARTTQSRSTLYGIAVALPLAALVGIGLVRRRHGR
jgi:uncharacterized protein